MAGRLADEQAHVRLHAYGVGRGVDKEELLRIISARDAATAEDRCAGCLWACERGALAAWQCHAVPSAFVGQCLSPLPASLAAWNGQQWQTGVYCLPPPVLLLQVPGAHGA